jgi:hypothetical protein
MALCPQQVPFSELSKHLIFKADGCDGKTASIETAVGINGSFVYVTQKFQFSTNGHSTTFTLDNANCLTPKELREMADALEKEIEEAKEVIEAKK